MKKFKADKLDRATAKMLRRLKRYTTKYWGKRCSEHCDDCPCCEMWARYDSLREYAS